MSAAADLRAAIAFLSVAGRGTTPTRGAMVWFPVVGALLGGVTGLAWWGASELWPPLLAAAMAVAVDLAVTGALHLDGLADSADGLLPHLPRDRRLAVMRGPDVGAFAMAAVVIVLVLRVTALASVEVRPLALAGLWCASRTAMAVVARVLPYARAEGGLASAFLGGSPWTVGLLGAVLAAALLAVEGGPALAAGAALVVATLPVAGLARRRLGGFTGDVLGALGVVGETVGLVVLAARW